MKKYDAVIIGFGKGGKTLAGAFAANGKTAAVIEKSDKMYGGTCINVGCIPSKSLVHSAKLSEEQGGSFKEKSLRYQAAIEEKNKLVEMLRNKNYHKLSDNEKITVYDGLASFVSEHVVRIENNNGAEEIEGQQIFINTGARPFIPPIQGLSESHYVYLSEALLDLSILPEHLLIIGGGYIGMEFASMYTNFGSSVTVIQDSAVFLPREDEEIAEAVLKRLQDKGVTVLFSAKIEKVSDTEELAEVLVNIGGMQKILKADAVLIAAGRRPDIQNLDLPKAGVEQTGRGAVKTDKHLKTTAENIYAMGDVTGGLQFTYISLDDFRIVKSQIFGDGSRTTENRGEVPYSVFLDPPFSRAGLSEKEALASGYEIKIAKLHASAIPKAQVLKQPAGLLKVIIDAKTDYILGAHLFCEESYEMINLVKLAMDARIPYTVLRDNIYTHPTMSESFNDLFTSVS